MDVSLWERDSSRLHECGHVESLLAIPPVPTAPVEAGAILQEGNCLGEKIVFSGPGHHLNIKEGARKLALGAWEGSPSEHRVCGPGLEGRAMVMRCCNALSWLPPRRVRGAEDHHFGVKLGLLATRRSRGGERVGAVGAVCTCAGLCCHRLTPEGRGSVPWRLISMGFIARR